MTLAEFLQLRGADRRLARLTHDLVLPAARGLEFGAADNPVAVPDGVTMVYVDHARDANAGLPDAVRVDHAWTGAGDLAALCGTGHDFAVAAQVAQYVPNLLGWLRGIHAVLRPGGVLNLSLPDRRFMFDVARHTSTLGELVEADLLDLARPSPRQVFDHVYGVRRVEPAQLWAGDGHATELPRFCGDHALALALERAQGALEPDGYASCHCWIFTPLSFLELIESAMELGLFPFVVSQFAPTEPDGCEFFVCLRRDAEEDPDALRAMQRGAVVHVRELAERRMQVARRLGAT